MAIEPSVRNLTIYLLKGINYLLSGIDPGGAAGLTEEYTFTVDG
jgi:hypothetical protein